MISFNFNLRNPWSNTFKNLWCRAYATPVNNKYIELEVIKDSSVISFAFNWSTRQSHSGLSFELGLIGYSFHFTFYDNRHWDVAEGCWIK